LILTTPNINGLEVSRSIPCSGFFGRDARPLNERSATPFTTIGLATFSELRYELHVSGFQLKEAAPYAYQTDQLSLFHLCAVDWLYTLLAFRREKDPKQRERNMEIRAALLSFSLLSANV